MTTVEHEDLRAEAESVAVALLQTPEGRSDPYPRYQRLRELAPVHRSEAARGWLLTGYDVCKSALRDPRFEKRYEEALDARSKHWRDRPALVWSGRTLLNLDGPVHARLRRQVFRSFTRGSVERMRPTVETMTDGLLDEFADGGGDDLMARVAFPLPIGVIGEMLGLPPDDLPAFRDRVLALTAAFELNVSKELLDAADAAAVECMDYFDALIAKKRASPAHDLLSQLVHGEETLTVEEINTLAMLVLFAGFETTTNLIGNGVLALLDHPDQLDLLRSQPELYANLPAELLRHGGTAQLVNRVTTEDVAIGEMVIPAGEAVFPLIGAANRDPDRYPDPDRLDVTRVDIRPLSFGGGVHHCLGAALAEMEIEIVFRKLIERFDLTDLASVRLPHRDRLVLRGPATVPIRLGRRLSNAGGSTGLSARPSTGDAQWRAEYRTRFEQTASGANREQITELVHVLERIPVFAAFGTAELALLATTAYPIAFDPEDRLCEQGSTAADCYVVIEGEAEISIDGSLVGSVGADEVVGERGPILDQARAATVTATSHVITFAISRDRLHEVMASNPDAAREMTKILAARYDG